MRQTMTTKRKTKYRAVRGVSERDGDGWRDWQAGETVSGASEAAGQEWLAIGAIEPGRDGGRSEGSNG